MRIMENSEVNSTAGAATADKRKCPSCGQELHQADWECVKCGWDFRKPTSGKQEQEWTREYVEDLWPQQVERLGFFDIIADAHNASITVERKRAEQAERVAQVCYDLHEALGVKWGDDPYAAIQQLREQLATANLRLAAAKEALQMLRDFQNGCPLPSYEKGWNEAMAMSEKVLNELANKS